MVETFKRRLNTALLGVGFTCALLTSSAKAAPQENLNIETVVDRSGLVIRAVVRKSDPNAYDHEAKAAFTRVELDISEVLLGSVDTRTLTLWLRGGVNLDGDIEGNSATPILVEGERYVLFIKDGTYYVTPFATPTAFREVSVSGQDVLVDQDGRLVDLGEEGIKFGPQLVESTQHLQRKALGWKEDDQIVKTLKELPSPAGAKAALLERVRSAAAESAVRRDRQAIHSRPDTLPHTLPKDDTRTQTQEGAAK